MAQPKITPTQITTGTGSGLDADSIDGNNTSFFTDASNLITGALPSGRLVGTYNINVSGSSSSIIFSGALVYSNSSTSIPHGVTTMINWDLEEYDIGGWHDNVTNNTRLTVISGVSMVRVIANIDFSNSNGGSYRQVSILKNGTFFNGQPREKMGSSSATSLSVSLTTAPIYVIPGDYFELAILQDSGITLLAPSGLPVSWLAIEKLG